MRNQVEVLVVSPFRNFSRCVTANITAEPDQSDQNPDQAR